MTTVGLSIFLLGLMVIVATAVYVAAPLFAPPTVRPPEEVASEDDRWERQRRQALAAIKELALDYEMGKLSDDDYARMRARFEAQALEAMAARERREPA